MLFKTKNGKAIEITKPIDSDALSLIEMMKLTYQESRFLTCYPDEFNISEEDEIRWINKFDHQTATMLVAKHNGRVIGSGSINSKASNRDKLKHRCTLGIALIEEYCNDGIGKVMMDELLNFASNASYTQVELEVVTSNHRAVALYKKLGFEIYGTIPNAFKERNGNYLDEYFMVKKL